MERVVLSGWLRSVTPNIYGFEACEPNHSFGPAVRPYYLLHYVLEGEGTFLTEGESHRVCKGDLFVIRPGIITTYSTGSESPWRYAWIGFHCPESISFLSDPVIRQPPVRHIFTYIRDHFREDGLDGKIYSLTHELLWVLAPLGENGVKRYAAYAKKYLDSAYMQNVSIAELAGQLHIDRRYLTRQFKDAYGLPPQEYLMEMRLEKAAQFLRQGSGVTEASIMSGFSDLPNFTRQFSRKYGVSPSSYKKQIKI